MAHRSDWPALSLVVVVVMVVVVVVVGSGLQPYHRDVLYGPIDAIPDVMGLMITLFYSVLTDGRTCIFVMTPFQHIILWGFN